MEIEKEIKRKLKEIKGNYKLEEIKGNERKSREPERKLTGN